MNILRKYFCILFSAGLSLFLLTGCGPSKEKIANAQEKYAELAALHNQVVNAHKDIEDASLDAELSSLFQELNQMDKLNLNEMKEEEIDALIQSMDEIITSYHEYLNTIGQIRDQEEASVITTIPVSLLNSTGLTFQKLTFQPKGDTSFPQNLLSEDSMLTDGQYMTGLFIYRDVQNTPWIFTLEDTEGNSYELELSVADYTEEGCDLTFTYDAEAHTITAE